MKSLRGWWALLGLLWVAYGAQAHAGAKASFEISIKEETNPYVRFSVFAMPGESLPMGGEASLAVSSEQVRVRSEGPGMWQVQAPTQPGAYTVHIAHPSGEAMVLNVLVLTPMSEAREEYLHGYRIGTYPSTPLRGNPIYLPPQGLFAITEANLDLPLTPHFTLRQFLCKQAGGYPKFVLVRERLLLKLEYLLEQAQAQGLEVETFGFISGYRTPYYNHSIGNVQYSRHVYGGAADIIVDQDGDGNMDDLNGDGQVDERDVRVFYDLVEAQVGKREYARFVGGLGFYRRNTRHYGFIHVDVRGTPARW